MNKILDEEKFVFCLQNIIGKTIEEAETICVPQKISVRVVKIDTFFVPGRHNYDADRCNVGITAGIITEVLGMY